MKRMIVCAVAIAFAAAGGALAQQSGGGSTGGGNTNTGGGGNTNANPNTGGGNQGGRGGQQGRQSNDPFGQQQQQIPEMPRPIFLSGKVVLDNGQPPPEPVTIVRTCSGQRFPESYSDPKGNFSFQVGANPTVALTDASVSGFGTGTGSGGFGSSPFGGGAFGGTQIPGDMSVNLTGCDLVAELPGFRSDAVSLGRRRTMDNPDVGVIVLHSLGGPVSSIVSATTLQAPKKAKSSYEKALREMTKKSASPEKAAKELEKAVAEYPQFAAAWALLGDTRAKQGDHAGAKEAYEKAVAADPDYLRPYPALVEMAVNANDWQRTSELSQKMLSINPGITRVRFYQAVAQLNLGKIDDARTTTMHIQSGPDAAQFPKTHQIMGLIYSQQGAFSEAAKEYRAYLQAEPDSSNAEKVKKQLNEWEVLGVIEPQ